MSTKTFTKEFFQKAGKKGGISTSKKGKEFYKKIGSMGGKTRWAKKVEENPPTI